MSNKFGLALVKHRDDGYTHLYEIPLYASLEVGDKVYVEGFEGVAEVVSVWNSIYLDTGDKEAFDMIMTACNAKLPLFKIKSKIILSDFKYEED
jgi:hypothetical protein